MNRKHIILWGFLGLLAVPAAMATPIKFNGVQGGLNVNISTPDGTYTTTAGVFKLQIGNPGSEFKTFCIDLYDNASTSYQNYTAGSLAAAPLVGGATPDQPMGPAAALAVSKLWAMNYSAALGDATKGQALQIAIWEVVTETKLGNSYDLTAGSFILNTTASGARTAANAMLTSLANYDENTHGPLPDLFAWTSAEGNNQFQDYIGVPDGGATLALLGLAMGVLSVASRRKRDRR